MAKIKVGGVNCDGDGYCKTIKAQYYKNSILNIGWGMFDENGGTYACTGVWVYIKDNKTNEEE